jgi:serum/glucocorticoid-regulated kinase 2
MSHRRYGLEVDWWTLGALLFEMLIGLPPFYDTDVQTMYYKILNQPLATAGLSPNVRKTLQSYSNRILSIAFYPALAHPLPQALSLIQGLLQRNPEMRLGKASVDHIYSHPFFTGLPWKVRSSSLVSLDARASPPHPPTPFLPPTFERIRLLLKES